MSYDREKRKAANARYYAANREKCAELSRQWKQESFPELREIRRRERSWAERRAAILARVDNAHRYR